MKEGTTKYYKYFQHILSTDFINNSCKSIKCDDLEIIFHLNKEMLNLFIMAQK